MSKARFIALLAAITLINVSFLFGQIAIAPASGDGSEAFPFQIATLENLFWIAAPDSIVPNPNRSVRWACHYQQTANIDASDTENWYGGEGWIPIGNNSTPFSGVYDGQNHAIDWLCLNRPSVSAQAFFGKADNAHIHNTKLKNINIQGDTDIAGLCARLYNSDIFNSSVQGSILAQSITQGLYTGSGGLAGITYNSTIRDSYSTGLVRSIGLQAGGIGGLVGWCERTDVLRCHSSALVKGGIAIGGLAGFFTESVAYNCFTRGHVIGNWMVGGLFGWNTTQTTISNSYSASRVYPLNQSSSLLGGLIGYTGYTNNPIDCYWDLEISGLATSAGGTGKTTEELMIVDTFSAWNFNDIWSTLFSANDVTYPYLNWQVDQKLHGVSNVSASINGNTVELSWDQYYIAGTPMYHSGFKAYRDGLLVNTEGNIEPNFNASTITYQTTVPQTGKEYIFSVTVASWIAGESTPTYLEVYVPLVAPAAPSDLSAAADSYHQVDLSWTDNSNDEESHEIQRKIGETGQWLSIGTTGVSVTSYTNTGLQPSTTYHYRVRAVNTAGPSDWSEPVSITTPEFYLSPPSAVIAAAVSYHTVNLSWTDNTSVESGFQVERRIGDEGEWQLIRVMGANVSAISDIGLSPDTTYHYRVRAFNDLGSSFWSEPAMVTTPEFYLDAPSNLIATSLSYYDINLGWTDNATVESGFEIHRRVGEAGDWQLVGTVNTNIRNYLDTGLNQFTTYYYKVRAFNSFGHSDWSNEAMATTQQGLELTIGDEASTTSQYGFTSPYGNYYRNNKNQYLVLVSELHAGGITGAEQISSLAFNVSSTNGCGPRPMTIKLGHTSQTELTTTFVTGTTLVFSANPYTPVTGWNNHEFISPFEWNGTDNIVVEVFYGNLSLSTTLDASVYYSSAPNMTLYFRSYSEDADAQTTGTLSANRVNMRFGLPGYEPTVVPNPAVSVWPNDAELIFTEGALRWQCSTGLVPSSYDVYFGSNPNPPFVGNQAGTSFTPDLTPDTVYYWKVVPVNGLGEAQNCTEWSFTYCSPPDGLGTQENPYEISSLEKLYWIAASDAVVPTPTRSERWARHYAQTADIDASATMNWFDGQGWSSIGVSDTYRFSGSYDGQGHIIDMLYINRPETNYIGLFGNMSGSLQSSISNLGLTNVNISGYGYTGALLGRNVSTSISNCYVTGAVNGWSNTAGLIGHNSGSVSNCYNAASIVGGGAVGGLIGYNVGQTREISQCFNTGSVSGGGSTGGLIGSGNGIIIDCFNTGTVSGGNTGGLSGFFGGTISNSYSTGSVVGNGTVGGMVGHNNGGTYINSYWNTQTSGQTSSNGGLGRTTAEMTYPYAANTYLDWDFEDIWMADVDFSFNDGYPYLIWQIPPEQFPKPTNLSAVFGLEEITLSWELPPREDLIGINVFRNGVLMNDEPIGENQYVDTGVAANIQYQYWVQALYTEGSSNLSEACVISIQLAGPQNMAGSLGSSSIELTWDEPSTGLVLGYLVYRNEELMNDVLLSETFYTDAELALGHSYEYQVKVSYSLGESQLSEPVAISTPTPQVSSFSAIPGYNQVNLSWNEPHNPYAGSRNTGQRMGDRSLTGYKLFRDGEQLQFVPFGTTSWLDLTVVNGVSYVYYITVVYSVGESLPSSSVSVQPEEALFDLNLQLSRTAENAMQLSWQPSPNASSYKVYRSETPGLDDGEAWVEIAEITDLEYTLATGDAAAFYRVSYVFYPQIDAPVFDPPAGTYIGDQTVSISCSTEAVTIRYTTDGSEPHESSAVFSTPLSITEDTSIKARAYKEGWLESDVSEAEYVISQLSDLFVHVPGGTFNMGDTRGQGLSSESPIHSVSLGSFLIGKYEVTQSEWQSIMGYNPASGYGVGAIYPVYYVSWYAVLKYCNLRSMTEGLNPVYTIAGSTNPADWGAVPTSSNDIWNAVVCNWDANGYRLPTEAEWEYAARGATNTPDYLYGGSDDVDAVAWYTGNNSPNGTKPVGEKAANGLGIYDMSGNVLEMCWDWYSSTYYSSSPSDNPSGPASGSSRLRRGGSWSSSASFCRVSARSSNSPHSTSSLMGFRLYRSAR